jgi:hypothetical protein
MICLDTNYLIRGLVKGTLESERLVRWHQTEEPLISAAPACTSFSADLFSQRQIRVMHAFRFFAEQLISL